MTWSSFQPPDSSTLPRELKAHLPTPLRKDLGEAPGVRGQELLARPYSQAASEAMNLPSELSQRACPLPGLATLPQAVPAPILGLCQLHQRQCHVWSPGRPKACRAPGMSTWASVPPALWTQVWGVGTKVWGGGREVGRVGGQRSMGRGVQATHKKNHKKSLKKTKQLHRKRKLPVNLFQSLVKTARFHRVRKRKLQPPSQESPLPGTREIRACPPP